MMSVTTKIDQSLALLTMSASLEAYNAYNPLDRPSCCLDPKCVTPPLGYDLVDCWTGVDTVFANNLVECFGVVFRSQSEPYSYIFAFRGTDSIFDAIDDLDFWYQAPFSPYYGWSDPVPSRPLVSSGFWDIYRTSIPGTPGTRARPSMQTQLFNLLEKYHGSINRLIITGHSLGAALCELFTLDLALSPYHGINYINYNYACPIVGDRAFAQLYNAQRQEQNPSTRTLRIQNTYDIIPCTPPSLPGLFSYQHAGTAYLLAFYNKNAGYIDPMAKYYDHQALNYQAVLTCAVQSPDGICVNDNLKVPTDAETLVSLKPDPTTLCQWWPMPTMTRRVPAGAALAPLQQPAVIAQPATAPIIPPPA
jgi:hypothetical protein